MNTYGDFHDSCITNLHFTSGSSVSPDKTMQLKKYRTALRLLNQQIPILLQISSNGVL
jgi:hypothetical protein